MAQMTRTDMINELNRRGWNRFTTPADLEHYCDMGLRDVIREARWTGQLKVAAIAAQSTPTVDFTTIDAGGVRQIKNVFITTDQKEDRLKAYGDEDFEDWLGEDPTEAQNKGEPDYYYVYQDKIYFIPAPDKAYAMSVHYIEDIVAWTAAGATSGLPERFDEAIMCAIEVYCFRRSHEIERMAVAQSEMRRIVLAEIVREGTVMEDRDRRVIPYR